MTRPLICIVDYGMGNLRSVINAFEFIGLRAMITNTPSDLAKASAVVLPGVGAFGEGMKNLRQAGFVEALSEEVLVKGKPFLGICLGLQFLAKNSLEDGNQEGLGWIDGTVERISYNNPSFRVPHMGWNDVHIERESVLFKGLEDGPIFYFVHSYHLVVDGEKEVVTSTCWHGETITASVQKDNMYAVQFHPEKSQRSGLRLLENFVKLAKE